MKFASFYIKGEIEYAKSIYYLLDEYKPNITKRIYGDFIFTVCDLRPKLKRNLDL